MLITMVLTNVPAPDLLPVLALPFGALLICCGIGLGIYKVWGRMKQSK